jgi:hypothetical protein
MTDSEYYVHGQPADVDAVVTVDGDHYVLARIEGEAVAEDEDVTVYEIDT